MWMNAALLSQCVMSMPIVWTLSALIVVPVKLDLLETEKHAPVRDQQNTQLSSISYLSIVSEGKSNIKVVVPVFSLNRGSCLIISVPIGIFLTCFDPPALVLRQALSCKLISKFATLNIHAQFRIEMVEPWVKLDALSRALRRASYRSTKSYLTRK